MPEKDHSCLTCGRELVAGQVLYGWRPCGCGGHSSVHCRDDTGGCGTTNYVPALRKTCRGPRMGFGRRFRLRGPDTS